MYQGFYKVDWQKVIDGTEFIKTIEDFTSLCLPSEDFKTNICKITEARWDVFPAHHYVLKPFDENVAGTPLLSPYQFKEGALLRFTITSNRFLRGMVRKTVGTILMIGKGKVSPEEFRDNVSAKKDFRIHYLSPPNGLFLSKIRYPYFS